MQTRSILSMLFVAISISAFSQNVGIGTTTPASQLHIRNGESGDTTGIKLTSASPILSNSLIYHNDPGDLVLRKQSETDQLVLDRYGNIGFGTSEPLTRLSITPSITEPKITLWDNGVSSTHYGMGVSSDQFNFHVPNTNADYVYQSEGKNGDGTELMRLNGTGQLSLGTTTATSKFNVNSTSRSTAQFQSSSSTGTWLALGNSSTGGKWHHLISTGTDNGEGAGKLLMFAGGSGYGVQGNLAMAMDSDGKVGIGTGSPLTRLSISPTTLEPKITLWDNGVSSTHYGMGVSGGQFNFHVPDADADYVFHSAGKNGDGTEHMRLNGTGQLSIGTTAATSKFNVNSTSNLTAQLESSSSIGTWLALGNSSSGGKWHHFISTGTDNGEGAGKLLMFAGGSGYGSQGNLAMVVNSDGRVAMGSGDFGTGYQLSVTGKIISTGVRVQIQGDWPDYVFEDDYQRPSLEEVRSFIDDRGHLPGFHPAAKMESEGVDVEEVSIQQQEWIEVNTLHLIDLNNRIKALEQELTEQEQLNARIDQLEQLVMTQSLAIEKLTNTSDNDQ